VRNSGGSATASLGISVKLVNPDGVIAAGASHACAIVDGGAWCWGLNDNGQLGNGSSGYSATPIPVSGLW